MPAQHHPVCPARDDSGPCSGCRVAAVEALHDRWADTSTDDLDPLDMWEQLGRALGKFS